MWHSLVICKLMPAVMWELVCVEVGTELFPVPCFKLSLFSSAGCYCLHQKQGI